MVKWRKKDAKWGKGREGGKNICRIKGVSQKDVTWVRYRRGKGRSDGRERTGEDMR